MELEYRRPLPPELLVEMHKCLPLANAIYVLVNVSKTFLINNSTRMRRNVQRIKTSLNEYIDSLVDEDNENENDRKELEISNDIQWKPELDAVLRYGAGMTSTRQFWMAQYSIITGIPENFVEELLLHLANSWVATFLIAKFLKPLFDDNQYRIGGRILFESVQLEMDNGQILQIYDGELIRPHLIGNYNLVLFVVNKMDRNNLLKITVDLDHSKEFIRQLEFSKWNMQSFDDISNFIKEQWWDSYDPIIKQNGNELEAKSHIYWDQNLDIILRHGAGFTQFRHFKIKERYFLYHYPKDYIDFLIIYISAAKHPEEFFESIDMNFYGSSLLIEKFFKICQKGISEGGKSIILKSNKKFHILSARISESKKNLKFTLANIPTNGTYLFDVKVKFGNEGIKQIVGIKIQKRKNDGNIVELKCEDQIGLGMKRKASNDDGEDGPTCSAKLMKK